MKKLMFVAAAIAAGVAVADVTSANVVGYVTPEESTEGFKMQGVAFQDVGKTDGSYSIQNLVPQGTVVPNGAGTEMDAAIKVQKLAADGSAVGGSSAYWRDGKQIPYSGSRKADLHGWYPWGSNKPSTLTLTSGEALWIKFPATAQCALSMSGEVPPTDLYADLNEGFTAICNPQPVEISIQSVEPFAAEPAVVPNGAGTSMDDAIKIQKIAADGSAVGGSSAYWRDGKQIPYSGSRKADLHGWYPWGSNKPTTLTVAPGEGLWVKCPAAGCSLRFPSPLVKDAE